MVNMVVYRVVNALNPSLAFIRGLIKDEFFVSENFQVNPFQSPSFLLPSQNYGFIVILKVVNKKIRSMVITYEGKEFTIPFR